MPKIKGLLFDWDGTLVDSVWAMYLGACNVFRESGLPIPDFPVFCATCFSPYAQYYHAFGVTASGEQILEWYRAAYVAERKFFPDAIGFVKSIAARGPLFSLGGIHLGIISASNRAKIEHACREVGIVEHFHMIVGDADEKIEPIKLFCRQNGILPGEALFIGDFVSDVRDAFAAGVIPVGITRGKNTAEVLKHAGANFVIDTLEELLPLL